MFNTFINSYKVTFAQNANQIIYVIKKLPLIGKKIPNKLYKETSAKVFLGVIGEVLSLLTGIIGNAIYLGVMVILPAVIYLKVSPNLFHTAHMGKVAHWQPYILTIFLHILLFFSLIFGPIFNSLVFKSDKQAFTMIVLMRTEPQKYYTSQIIYKRLIGLIHFMVPMIITGLIIGFSPRIAAMLSAEIIAAKLIGESLELFIYEKTKTIIINGKIFGYGAIIVIPLAGYIFPMLGLTVYAKPILFNPLFALVLCAAAAIALYYIINYRKYKDISAEVLDRTKFLKLQAMGDDMKFIDVRIDEKKMTKEDLNSTKYNNKTGYEYLNAIFFHRHRKILISPIKDRAVIIAIAFVVLMYFVMFTNQKSNILKLIYTSSGFMMFIMYFMSTGEKNCRAMFHNCDVGLLRYSYYRESKAILHNFTLRLKRVVLINLIPALALSVGITIIAAVGSTNSNELIKIVPIIICIFCLSCFFSIHNLFMYYIIQPYTAELTIKSPIFKVVQWTTYLICYSCYRLKITSNIFTFGVIAATIIYMIIALILIYKISPKTFRLK